jgi:retinol dehydrogenase-12
MDAEGKVVVVTGATNGLGQQAAIDLARRGARVLVVGRSKERADETLREIAAAGGEGAAILGDVSTLSGVREIARSILARSQRVHVLLNNAGGTFSKQQMTADGVEMTFALNTLGAFRLERELHQALVSARGRVVNVATGFLDMVRMGSAEELPAPKKYSGLSQYSRAKLASVMMTVEQARRFETDGVTAVSVHPGIIMGTQFGGGQPKVAQVFGGPIMRAIGLGATLAEASRRFQVACLEDVPSGSYLVKGRPAPVPKDARDEATRATVWDLLERWASRAAPTTRAA